MAEKLPNKILEIEYPGEITDKNTLFTSVFRSLRRMIASDDRYSGKLRPLGDIDVISTSEAMKWMGIENMANFRHHRIEYEKIHGPIRVIGFQKPEEKKGPIFLREDLADLRMYVLGKQGRLNALLELPKDE